MISVKTTAVFILLAFSISLASAEESRFHEYDYNNVDTLSISARVGTVIVEPSTSGKFEVELHISDENNPRWFRRSPDTSRMDLNSVRRGNELRLNFDHKDVKTDWVVRVPELGRIDIELGVGTVEVLDLAAGINADVGVGTIEIRTPVDSAGVVDLSVGVGDTVINGGNNRNSRRALVSSESSAMGQGNNTVKARVGVGSIEVELL
jgi:hypothetical protein